MVFVCLTSLSTKMLHAPGARACASKSSVGLTSLTAALEAGIAMVVVVALDALVAALADWKIRIRAVVVRRAHDALEVRVTRRRAGRAICIAETLATRTGGDVASRALGGAVRVALAEGDTRVALADFASAAVAIQ